MRGPHEVHLGSENHIVPFQSPAESRIAGARARKKTGNGFRRAGWRGFGEYIFLEDSRYASQRKNLTRKRI